MKLVTAIFLYFPIVSYASLLTTEYKNGYVVEFDRFCSLCPDRESDLNISNIVNYKNSETNTTVFKFDLDLYKDVPMQSKLVFDIERCATKEAPDTCMKTGALRTSNYCPMIDKVKGVWTPILSCIHPGPLRCPVKKGHYKGQECTFTLENFNWFPIGRQYYNIRVVLENKKPKYYFCLLISGQLRRKRD